MAAEPVRQRPRPTRLSAGKVRRAEHRERLAPDRPPAVAGVGMRSLHETCNLPYLIRHGLDSTPDFAHPDVARCRLAWRQRCGSNAPDRFSRGDHLLKHLIAFAAATLALQGCTNTPAPQIAGPDFNEGQAKTCMATPVDFSNAASATAKISMTNDGWCAVRTTEKDSQPFLLGLMKARPAHGHVVIQKVGSQTRVEYTADNRYVGTDTFAVSLRSHAASPSTPDATLQVEVQVTMGENMSAPLPTPAPAPSTRRPGRR